MRAVVFSGPRDIASTAVAEVPVPRPAPTQVSIDVSHAGINFADVMARRGDAGYAASWPHVPGLEVAGLVREVGQAVTGFLPGDDVVAATPAGGLAEVAIAEVAATVGRPEPVAPGVGAAVPLLVASGLMLLTQVAGVQPGERLLLHSASGGIGSVVGALAASLDLPVRIGTVGHPGKAAAALAGGFTHAVARDDATAAFLREVTHGHGADVILDPLGTAESLAMDLEAAAPGARVVLFGNASGGALAPLPPAGRLIGGNLTISGFSHRGLLASSPKRIHSAMQDSLDLLRIGALKLPVTMVDGLERVHETHDLLAGGRGSGKYVVAV